MLGFFCVCILQANSEILILERAGAPSTKGTLQALEGFNRNLSSAFEEKVGVYFIF
jgi:hypothetical protein